MESMLHRVTVFQWEPNNQFLKIENQKSREKEHGAKLKTGESTRRLLKP